MLNNVCVIAIDHINMVNMHATHISVHTNLIDTPRWISNPILMMIYQSLKDDGYYNVRYQYKPLMIWIWISTIFIGFGGLLSVIRKNEQKY